MSAIWELAQHWRELSFVSLSLLPLSSLLLFTGKQFDWSKPEGVNSYIKLFVIDESSAAGTPAAVSVTSTSGGGSQVSKSYEIVQVSAEAGGSRSSLNSKLALVAKMPLTSIENLSNWEYCLPTSSPLTTTTQVQVQAAVSTESASSGECSLQKWSSSSSSGESKNTSGNPETIKYLLELASKYIRLQHQVNMIYLFHAKKQENSASSSTASSNDLSKVNGECGFKSDTAGEANSTSTLAQQMLLTSTAKVKKCLPFPLLVEIYLKLKSSTATTVASSESTTSSSITQEKIKNGELWGQLSYGLTDYWGNVKQVNRHGGNESAQKEPVLIEVPLILNYTLSEPSDSSDGCNSTTSNSDDSKPRNFEQLWQKYTDRSLRLCHYLKNKETKKER
ncbi:hypothetical protein [Candidatus Mycoplasma haematominutum]|uniref:Uncharacterized protein n=1 Tax=Candidatus Mycoplasma haematominutum 'Birmingham 1' TaxID=1116213 RepID=G8C3B6_9MOLU|nr:hypothetical protein [Candidatus Mycoplasma haematominutum]CCE66814.1 hypothetical protein MHM_02960 [Candidatus Mycoplasma haematominutum 'Birmingham 1']